MLEEGFDDPSIDTLILCTPRSRVQQTIGRAERTAPGKLTPVVYDVVDSNHIFEAMSVKRMAFYKTRGFKIEGGKTQVVFEPEGVIIE
jgi:superfamily II DNA or RNA helicase